MTWGSIVAIYALFWVMTAFVILPIGVRTHDELGIPKIAGQADSAPGNFQPRTILLRTTALSAALFALYYLNYSYGWINRDSFDALFNPPK
jgi:predicted secreted protein